MQKESIYVSIIMLITSTILVLLPVFFIIIFTILYQKRHAAFLGRLEALKSANEKELLRSQLEIQERTFEKISQEIHDNIGQEISIAKLYLSTVDRFNPDEVDIKTTEAIQLLTKVMDDVRSLSKYLNSNTIQTNGLTEVIRGNLEQIERTGKLTTTLNIEGEIKYLDESKEFAIFRIFQEAVNNVIKHAKANQISVALDYRSHELALMIADDGSGFLPHSSEENKYSHTSGINNMQKRAMLIGANYSLDSSVENGTVVKLIIPYNND